MKIVDLRQSLLRGRSLEELHVLARVALAVGQLVDLFLAAEDVRIALEKALLEIVEDGQAERLDLQAD